MDHPISTRRPNLVLINKKKRHCQLVNSSISADHRELKKAKSSRTTKLCLNLSKYCKTFDSL